MAWRWNIDRGRGLEGAALAACIVLAATVLCLALRLVRLLVPGGEAAYDGASVRVGDAAGAPSTSIAKWHLFGDTPAVAGGGAAAQSMILRGTLADRDAGSGIAVIDAGSGERAYRAGEIIASNVKLVRVYADRVTLSRDGVESTLTLTRDRNLMPANIVRPSAAPAPGSPRSHASSAPSRADGSAARAISPETRQVIEHARQHPEDLARLVQIAPVVAGGRVTGVRVGTGTDAALMNAMGLRAGDVVTAVNGAPVDSLARGQQIIEGLRTAASARVTVLRDGKPVDITISLK